MTSRLPATFGWILFATLPGCDRASAPATGTRVPRAVVFQTHQEIPAALDGLRAFVARDFTADGLVDIVVTSLLDKSVRLLVASSPGNLSTRAGFTRAFPDAPSDVAAGDFDNDGDVDFACLFETAGTVRVFRNDGAGRFREDARALTAGAAPTGLVALDLNGSGHADLAVAAASGLRVFLSRGSAGFAGAQALNVAGAALTALWGGDLNGDGRADLAATDGGGDRVIVWFQDAAGFDPTKRMIVTTRGENPVALTASDVTGDGVIDLVVANLASSTLSVLEGNGRGNFGQPIVVSLDGNPYHVCTGEVYGDGRQHVVVSYLDRASVGVVRSNGRGSFGPERRYGTSGLPTMAQVVDLDGDGAPGVLATGLQSTAFSWLRGSGTDGLLASESFRAGPTTPAAVVVADFDGDGNADVVVSDAAAGVCTVLRGAPREPGGFLRRTADLRVGADPASAAVGDFDRDGRPDVAVAVRGGLRFLLNRSAGGGIAFAIEPDPAGPPLAVGGGPLCVVAGRLDADPWDDVAVAEPGADRLFVLRAKGPGFGFAVGPEIRLAGRPLRLVRAELTGDGRPDLAVARYAAGVVTVLAGDGRGGFAPRLDLATGSEPSGLLAADLDRDGVSDLVVSRRGQPRVTVFRAGPAGYTRTEVPAGEEPVVLLVDDLNGDGRPDVLAGDGRGADFRALLGDGRGGFAAVYRFPGTFQAAVAAGGDTNGDGRPDLIVTSAFTNRISLYVNRSK